MASRSEDGLFGEMLARAGGGRDGESGVGADVVGRNLVAVAEVGDQDLGRGDLARGGGGLVEVADQADADAVFVDVGGLAVAAWTPCFWFDQRWATSIRPSGLPVPLPMTKW